MPKIICQKCGKENNDINYYCLKCKNSLKQGSPLEIKREENLKKISWKKAVLFPPKEYINEIAKGNIALDWTKNPKVLIILLVVISMFLMFWSIPIQNDIPENMRKTMIDGYVDYISSFSFIMPILYFIIKNYRLGYVLFIIYSVMTKLLAVFLVGRNPGFAVFWCFVVTAIAITGIRIQSAKVRLGLDKKTNIFLDIIIVIFIFAIFFIPSLIYLSGSLN